MRLIVGWPMINASPNHVSERSGQGQSQRPGASRAWPFGSCQSKPPSHYNIASESPQSAAFLAYASTHETHARVWLRAYSMKEAQKRKRADKTTRTPLAGCGIRLARNQRAGGIELKMLLIVGPSSATARKTASATKRMMSAYSTRPCPRLAMPSLVRCDTRRSADAALAGRVGSIRIVTIPHHMHIHRIARPITRHPVLQRMMEHSEPSSEVSAKNHCLR